MGTALIILIYESREDAEANQFNVPLAAIVRSQDGDTAYDQALGFIDGAMIVNGTYDEKPDWQYNGVGQFAIALLNYLRDDGYEEQTTLAPVFDFIDGDMNPDPDTIGDSTISLVVWCQDGINNHGHVSHSAY